MVASYFSEGSVLCSEYGLGRLGLNECCVLCVMKTYASEGCILVITAGFASEDYMGVVSLFKLVGYANDC